MNKQSNANALINETSPYLLQHAHNPVQWYPWSEQALSLARLQDKPILLSIGYSACHWCHVMAHESFEDDATAEVMNKHFINIKVDREERPDLDKIYQTAQQLLTQRTGGWPLTMILSPDDHVPFFGGTYFPPQARFGLPGFKDLLLRVSELYENERQAITTQNTAIVDALEQIQKPPQAFTSDLDAGPISQGIEEMSHYFDSVNGGFGGAPKFPQTPGLEYLLTATRHVKPALAQSSLQMVNLNLTKMAEGGIYDQLGGGFCRYTVDQYWLIPHFEKMLYDNGPLLYNYAQAWKLTGKEIYQRIARETAEWIMRDMQSDEGGYYSSLDADSEGEEGKFYVWDKEEIQQNLTTDEYKLFSIHYGLENSPNFEGHWHLYIDTELEQLQQTADGEPQTSTQLLASARHKLLAIRNKRIWPARDEKFLSSWNALAIKGMSMAALRLNNVTYLDSALKALVFIHTNMWSDDRLSASYKDGKSHLNAYLDDYVFLIDAILTILAVKWDSKWMDFALQLASVLMDQFYDEENGGFYFTSHDHEKLLQRRRDFMDDATPSGNGIAARVLQQLGHLSGNQQFMAAAERTLRTTYQPMQEQPHAHASLMAALCDYNFPPAQVILRGKKQDISQWKNQCYEATDDINMRVYAIPEDNLKLPGLLADRIPTDTTIAYVCEGFVCRQPINELEQLISDLKQSAHK